jgi:hypothetical protein
VYLRRAARFVLCGNLTLLASACDQGTPELENSDRPPLHLVSSYPKDGEGLDCTPGSGSACGVPRNAAIELRFDRFLLHSTAVRQSVALYTQRPETQVFLLPDYDVVERVVRFRPREPLEPNVLYTVKLTLPTESAPFGFRAFDGGPLEAGSVPLSFTFLTSAELLPGALPCQPSCQAIATRLGASGCTRHGCHNAEGDPSQCPRGEALDHNRECVGVPRMGLDLRAPEGLISTAIDQVAHQTETGPTGGIAFVSPTRMGIQMPLIDGGRPGNSYLLYKLLLRPANLNALPDASLTDDERERRVRCTPAYRSAPPDGQGIAADETERNRLREWFVRGEGMPLVSREGDPSTSPVTLDFLHELQRWIALGAPCP